MLVQNIQTINGYKIERVDLDMAVINSANKKGSGNSPPPRVKGVCIAYCPAIGERPALVVYHKCLLVPKNSSAVTKR